MAAYFGCRPTSMFDTTSCFKDVKDTNLATLVDDITVENQSQSDTKYDAKVKKETGWPEGDIPVASNEGLSDDEVFSDFYESKSEGENSNHNTDKSKIEDTRCIRWRDIHFFVIPNSEPKKLNILLAKVVLEHTKGEDRHLSR